MSLKKFVAPTSREALAAVKRELGGDAVVLANRRVREGVEITAMAGEAVDAVVELASAAEAAPRGAEPAPRDPEPFTTFLRRTGRAPDPAPAPRSTASFLKERAEKEAEREAKSRAARPAEAPKSVPAPVAPIVPVPAEPDTRLIDEIHAMKAALADQLAAFAWFDGARKNPLKARLTGELLSAGFSPALARGLMERLPADFAEEEARRWMASALVRNLAVHGAGSFLDAGGVFALVGPTGVGKTTTTAKLAARYAMRYGAKHVGLVTTDSYRIGAHDQLKIYGRILGIPVNLARGGSLASAIEALGDKKVVLVDTVGVGQRDSRVPELMAELTAARAKKVLLVNAASQGETLDEVLRIYRPLGLDGGIVTKIDEAARLGGALDCAVRHQLPLAFITNGQRVPEDLHPAESRFLVQRALRAGTSPAFALKDEEHGILFARSARAGAETFHAA
jgi:flagellar biosynthesis protein FlhF